MGHDTIFANSCHETTSFSSPAKVVQPENSQENNQNVVLEGASIVGGAISFVKELEHHLQALEAKKFTLTQQQKQDAIIHDPNGDIATNNMNESEIPQLPLYFRKLFSFPQYTWSQLPCKNNLSKSNSTIANIEVNLVNEHANLRILMRKQLTQLSKIVGLLETSCLTILHLNVTTLDAFVLYSISLKVEEGCGLDSADEIANAVHRILGLT
ncbi:myc-type, basic helix-loop-helix (bHLH) domain-containing protein [Artemisia annua]|uniref:Myc-type, basic helix-loop-helix (BHLH) domain-containing protein n=1 Tax=Artemisia annua TaxID=35608 RepID=A0A2U1LY03_ARTAN|nr:myc-type, basic helix-loop-helix (bHLH) domain-containing protein [Artemisia annua]